MSMDPGSDRSGTTRDLGRLLISCPDRPGIVAAVSRFLFERGANIIYSDQHSTDRRGGVFFMRVEFQLPGLDATTDGVEHAFEPIAREFDMEWRLTRACEPKRLAIFVSRADHALFELLWRHQAGEIPAEITMVISNHLDLEGAVRFRGIPYHYVPVLAGQKDEAEERQLALLRDAGVDTVVLARYMQVLSGAFLQRFSGRIINIHHSFLPAFVGANPYQQAYERGVKLIGATAHYVTEELDAGPIIEQDVARVDHRHGAADLRRIGRQVERTVLAKAVALHVEDRVLIFGNKTIVFG